MFFTLININIMFLRQNVLFMQLNKLRRVLNNDLLANYIYFYIPNHFPFPNFSVFKPWHHGFKLASISNLPKSPRQKRDGEYMYSIVQGTWSYLGVTSSPVLACRGHAVPPLRAREHAVPPLRVTSFNSNAFVLVIGLTVGEYFVFNRAQATKIKSATRNRT